MVEIDVKPFVDATCVKTGDTFEILDEGWFVDIELEGKTKTLFQITIKVTDLEYVWTPNKTSKLDLSKRWGQDTKNWVGKKGTFTVVDTKAFGKDMKVVYGAPLEKVKK